MIIEKRVRRYDISVLRVFSMIMIILCHIIKNYSIIPLSDSLSEVFNAAVYSFLGISGYLFGTKQIDTFSIWFRAREKRIWVPVVIVTIIDVICLALFSGIVIPIHQVATYVLNLQGLMFVSWSLFNKILGGEIGNLGPLWFTTVIMLCYCCVPFLQWFRNRTQKCFYKRVVFLITGYVLCIVALYSIDFHLFYFAAFAVGYYFSVFHSEGRRLGCQKVVLITALTLVLQVGRLILLRSADGTMLYNAYIGVSHTAFGLCMLVIATESYYIRSGIFDFGKSSIIRVLDQYSLYVYMVHQLFCAPPWNVYERFSIIPATGLFLLLSCSAAVLLRLLTESVWKFFDKA